MTSDSGKDQLSRADRINLRISVIQTVLAVTGIFVGIVALYAAFNEADSVRKQLHASVWPHLTVKGINYGKPGEEKFEVIVGNRGIGPAIVKFAEVSVDEEPQPSWFHVVDTIADGRRFGLSNFNLQGTVLSPGEDITLLSIEAQFATLETVVAFRDLARSDRMKFRVCYCSVFDDCQALLLSVNGPETTPLDSCPTANPESKI